nr:carbon-nitrogen hydrolase family protein [Patulibacter sp. SYSU D01012]
MTIAVAETASRPGDVAANARTTAELARRAAAAGARLLVLPELSLVGYDLDLLDRDEAWVLPDDARLDPIRAAAAETDVAVVVGAAVREAGGPRLASIVLRDGRETVAPKQHLHGAERERFVPADAPAPPFALDGWRVGLGICFDAAVPRHAQAVADAGAELYAVSALYVTGEERRLDVHMAARAQDHRMFVALANHAAGPRPGWTSCGLSGVWAPDATRVPAPDAGAGLRVARLSAAALAPRAPAVA